MRAALGLVEQGDNSQNITTRWALRSIRNIRSLDATALPKFKADEAR